MRRRARTDANHQEILDALRAIGCCAWSTHQIGGGFPDIVASRAGETWCLEVKDGSLPPSARRLTRDELRFAATWRGKYAVVTSAEEARRIVLRT